MVQRRNKGMSIYYNGCIWYRISRDVILYYGLEHSGYFNAYFSITNDGYLVLSLNKYARRHMYPVEIISYYIDSPSRFVITGINFLKTRIYNLIKKYHPDTEFLHVTLPVTMVSPKTVKFSIKDSEVW